MSNIQSCPDCGKALKISINRCTCGWKQSNKKITPVADYGCQFRDSDNRCKKIGVSSPFIKGQWYCSEHAEWVRTSYLKELENKHFQRTSST